ncbi:MAG: DUF3159 domain-containing protein [Acidimicrobiales bacterium]
MEADEVTEPGAGLQGMTSKSILRSAGPRLLRDTLGPTLCFYAGWKIVGLWLGITLGTVFAVSAYRYERRRGRPGLIARLVLGFVALQAIVGLATDSATAYLIQPTILGAVNGIVWLGSVAIGKPLAGMFAREIFPIDDATRASADFQATFARVSATWGTFFIAFAGVQLVVLLSVGIDAYVGLRILDAVFVLTLIVWSVRFVTGRLGDPAPGMLGVGDVAPTT